MLITGAERRLIKAELRDFAFERNPMFRRDAVQGVEDKRKFIMSDEREIPIQYRGRIKPDVTIIELGFNAVRLYGGGGPRYTYNFCQEFSREMEFDDLPDDIGAAAIQAYCRMETGKDLEDVVREIQDEDGDVLHGDGSLDMELLHDAASQLVQEIKEDDDVELMHFKAMNYSIDPTLTVTRRFDTGYTLSGNVFYCAGTSEVAHDTSLTRVASAPEREFFDPNGADVDAELQLLAEFDAIIRGEDMAELGRVDIATFEEKMSQVRMIMRAFRTGEFDPDFMGRAY